MRSYEMTHTVGFEETNFLGNVYYVNHLSWQGRCREMFLRDKAPGVLRELESGLSLVTMSCSCEYRAELAPFDEIRIRMFLDSLSQNRMSLVFEYWRTNRGADELVARGAQEIACMRRERGEMSPVPFPAELQEALSQYVGSGRASPAD
jgi:enediyne biosynthesis thioesterase